MAPQLKDVIDINQDIDHIKACIEQNPNILHDRRLSKNMRANIRRIHGNDGMTAIFGMKGEGTIATRAYDIAKDSNIADAVRYVYEQSKTTNAQAGHLSHLKKHIIDDGNDTMLASLKDDKLYKEINAEHAASSSDKLLEQGVKDIEHNFTYNGIMDKLNNIVKRIKDGKFELDYEDLMYILMNYSARPSELYSLEIDDDGEIGGHVKQRGSDRKYEYTGYLDLADARMLLNHIKSEFPDWNPKGNNTRYQHLRRYMNKQYDLNIRDLRTISSRLLTAHIVKDSDPVKTILTQAKILRHVNKMNALSYVGNGTESEEDRLLNIFKGLEDGVDYAEYKGMVADWNDNDTFKVIFGYLPYSKATRAVNIKLKPIGRKIVRNATRYWLSKI
jgi:hypothetical protein